MKNAIKVLLIFLFVLFIIAISFFYKFPDGNYSFELIISLLSITYLIFDSNLEKIDYLLMKIIFAITIIIQTLSGCTIVFFDISIIKNLNLLASVLIVFELSLYIIMKFLSNYVLNDIKILQKRTVKKLKKIDLNENSTLLDINNIYGDIYCWIIKNKKNNLKDHKSYKILMNLVSKLISSTEMLIHRNNLEIGNINEYNDTLLKILRETYYAIHKDMKLFDSYIDVFLQVIEKNIVLGNNVLLKKYLNLYHQFLTNEIKLNNSKNVSWLLFKFYNYLEKFEDSEFDFSNEELLNSLDDLFESFYIFNYKIDNQMFYSIVTGYIGSLKIFNTGNKTLFTVERLKNIIALINNESENSNNHFFENFVLRSIYSSPEKISDKISLITSIYAIYEANTYNYNHIVYSICDYLMDYYLDLTSYSDIRLEIITLEMILVSNLKVEDLGIIRMGEIIDLLVKEGVDSDETIETTKLLIGHTYNNNNIYNYILYILGEKLNEDNFNEYISLIKIVVDKIYIHIERNVLIGAIRLIDLCLNIGSKKYIKNIDGFKPHLKTIFEICDRIIENNSDFEIKEILFQTIDENLKCSSLEEDLFEYIYKNAIKSIEFLEIDLMRCLSNIMGWYLYRKIAAIEEGGNINLTSRTYSKIVKFYQLSCDYIKDIDSSNIFVGTIFVINFVLLQLKINSYASRNSDIYMKYKNIKIRFEAQLGALNDRQKIILKSAFRIRKELIETYFTDEKDIKNICNKLEDDLFKRKK